MKEDIPLYSLTRKETDRVVAAARDPGELSVITGHSSSLVDLAVMVGLVRAQSEADLQNQEGQTLGPALNYNLPHLLYS